MAQMSKFGLAVDSHLKDMQGCGAMCSETTARGSDGFGWFGCNSWEEGDSLSVSLDSYDPC